MQSSSKGGVEINVPETIGVLLVVEVMSMAITTSLHEKRGVRL